MRRWKILMALTTIVMAVTMALMFLSFSPIHIIMFVTQAILLATQYSSLELLNELKEQAE
jgi:hypothetical protein